MIFNESGSDRVIDIIDDCQIHALNLAEVMRKLVALGKRPEEVISEIGSLELEVVDNFGFDEANEVARLAPEARRLGLSLSDCVCLITAKASGLTAVTAERRWPEIRGWRVNLLQIR